MESSALPYYLVFIQAVPEGIVDILVTDKDFPGDVDCIAQPVNCFREVVITPSISNIYEELVSCCEIGEYNEFFESDDWQLLFPYLDEEFIDSFLASEGQIFIREFPDEDQAFALFSEPGNDEDDIDEDLIVCACPLSFSLE